MVEKGNKSTGASPIRVWSKGRGVPLSLIATGLLLLIVTGSYYLYSYVAHSQLGSLEYRIPEGDMEPSPLSKGETSEFTILYPGSAVASVYWYNPRWSDVGYGANNELPVGFTPVDPTGISMDERGFTAPTRIKIPAIGIDSTVKALAVLSYGDAMGWETPKDVVGHIPTSARPGETGNGYLFGHMQSPIKGEGSVFRSLINVPGLLREGQNVYILLYNQQEQAYIYQVTHTNVVEAGKFTMDATPDATITLVSCVPKYVYDHRLLVTAKLIGRQG